MLGVIGKAFIIGLVFGAFLAGAAFGLTGMFLFLMWVTDTYEGWQKARRHKRYEQERHERWLAIQEEQAKRQAAAMGTVTS